MSFSPLLGPDIPPFAPADSTPPPSLPRFFKWALRGAGWGIAWATFWSFMVGGLEAVTATFLGLIVDRLSSANPATAIADHALLLLAFALYYLMLRPFLFCMNPAAASVRIEPNIFPLILSRLHRYTMGQAVTFFDNDFAGRIAQKQMQTARAATDVVSSLIETAAFALSSVVGSLLLLGSIHGGVAGMLLFWVLGYGLFIRHSLRRVRGASGARAAARAMVTGQIVDTVTNMKTVKLFAHAEHEDRVALQAMAGFREKAIDYGIISSWFRFTLSTIAGVLPVLLVGGTVYLWAQGQASMGDIAAAGTVSFRLSQMTGWVSFSLMSIFGNLGEVEDGLRTLAQPYTLQDSPDARDMGRVAGRIEMQQVSFAYGRRRGGLDRVSLTIQPGEKIGIVGESGAGKTTLVALLLRLYDPEGGHIRIDGQDLRDVTQHSLRRQIAMVTQETAMFNRSARENILYGRPGASEDQMIAAARTARAHDFILTLKDSAGRSGYDAHLGERGVKLSGGQRQRIALARAILKDAPILVLDEATSALDSQVEAHIQDALAQVMQGKTVLAIAHRLSTIAEMDRIIVLDQGHIVEQGKHADLLALGGLYAQYWNRQSGGFLGIDLAQAAS
jgi:ATP-binding cassette, subfamily B, bacterial